MTTRSVIVGGMAGALISWAAAATGAEVLAGGPQWTALAGINPGVGRAMWLKPQGPGSPAQGHWVLAGRGARGWVVLDHSLIGYGGRWSEESVKRAVKNAEVEQARAACLPPGPGPGPWAAVGPRPGPPPWCGPPPPQPPPGPAPGPGPAPRPWPLGRVIVPAANVPAARGGPVVQGRPLPAARPSCLATAMPVAVAQQRLPVVAARPVAPPRIPVGAAASRPVSVRRR